MRINISSLTGDRIELEVSPRDTVDQIKEKISKKNGVDVFKQRIVWNGLELKRGNQSLDDAGIIDQATLNLLVSSKPANMTVYVQNNTNSKKFKIEDMDTDSTVLEMKEKVHKHEDIPVSQQRLTFGTKNLDDDRKTLRQAGMRDGSTLHLGGRLRGG